jgi:hypothetical protein
MVTERHEADRLLKFSGERKYQRDGIGMNQQTACMVLKTIDATALRNNLYKQKIGSLLSSISSLPFTHSIMVML